MNINNRPIEKRWLRVKELAVYLGSSPSNIYNLVHKGLLPFSKIKGIGIRFDLVKINAILEENETPSSRELVDNIFR